MSEQIEQKLKLVEKMMSLYCKKHHQSHNNSILCEECEVLRQYSAQRSRLCKNQKGFCAHCPTPCYAPDKRLQMREVMKFSGPRIALYHPIWVGKHMIETRRKNVSTGKKVKTQDKAIGIGKRFYILLGCIALGLGAVGAVLPMMPAFPFLLLSFICFGKSSEKLSNWLISTKLYKDNLESWVEKKGMSKAAKIRICTTVTLIMAFSFMMMKNVPVGRAVLLAVWVFHIVFFIFLVKPAEETSF